MLLPEADYFMSSQSVRRKEIISTDTYTHPACSFVVHKQRYPTRPLNWVMVCPTNHVISTMPPMMSREHIFDPCALDTHTHQASILTIQWFALSANFCTNHYFIHSFLRTRGESHLRTHRRSMCVLLDLDPDLAPQNSRTYKFVCVCLRVYGCVFVCKRLFVCFLF